MGYASYDDVARAFVAQCRYDRNTRVPKNERMYPSGDHLFSYGSHFTLVQALRNKKGEFTGWLVNGDTYSVTTSRHQSVVRTALIGHGPSVIVPFSALNSAGIDLDTVELVDVLPDREEETVRRYTEIQSSWRWQQHPVHSRRPKTRAELEHMVAKKNEHGRSEHYFRIERALQTSMNEDDLKPWQRGDLEYLPGGPKYLRREVTIDDLGHWDTRDVDFIECHYPVLHTSGHQHAPEVEIIEVGGEVIEYVVRTSRHWLGESLIKAVVPETRTITCTDCGGTGFPQPKVATPNRFGDIPDHSSGCDTCGFWSPHGNRRGSGTRTVTRRRKAMFLSGFDHNETRNLYFFSELPNTRATTVEEAYEVLKPKPVKVAEMMGREIQRQGDIFAVPMAHLDRATLRKMGARFEKGGMLLGTNHKATEVARLKGGVTLALGTLTHAPEWRRPDHTRVTLPKGVWHLTVKNTVPITRGR